MCRHAPARKSPVPRQTFCRRSDVHADNALRNHLPRSVDDKKRSQGSGQVTVPWQQPEVHGRQPVVHPRQRFRRSRQIVARCVFPLVSPRLAEMRSGLIVDRAEALIVFRRQLIVPRNQFGCPHGELNSSRRAVGSCRSPFRLLREGNSVVREEQLSSRRDQVSCTAAQVSWCSATTELVARYN
jgi:hypothetical protein